MFECAMCGAIGGRGKMWQHVGTTHISRDIVPYTYECGKIFSTKRELRRHQQRTNCNHFNKGKSNSTMFFKQLILKKENLNDNLDTTSMPDLVSVSTSTEEELDYEDLPITEEELKELEKLLADDI